MSAFNLLPGRCLQVWSTEIGGKRCSLWTKHVEKPETRNAPCAAAYICLNKYNQKLSTSSLQKWFVVVARQRESGDIAKVSSQA